MKKIVSFLCGMLLLISLSACNVNFTNPEAPLNTILTDDTTYEVIQTNITKTVEEVKEACVGVYVEYRSTNGRVASVGSGVIYKMIDNKTELPATEDSTIVTCYVVTNEHVINTNNGTDVEYSIYIGNDIYLKADPVGSDANNDLAVLTCSVDLSKHSLKTIPLDSEVDNLAVAGNYCIAIGCPLSLDNFNYVSVGHIAKVSLGDIMHTASINPGNSGGALFSVSGKLIGINYMKNTIIEEDGEIIPIEGMGYTIPIWKVKSVVEDIETTNKEIIRPTLGVMVTQVNVTLDPEASDLIPNQSADGTDIYQGVVISEVTENSNASRATSTSSNVVGLQPGDYIYKINDCLVSRNTDVSYELNTTLKGEEMTIVVYRKVIDNEDAQGDLWREFVYTIKLQ